MDIKTEQAPGVMATLKQMLPFGRRFAGRIMLSLLLILLAGAIQLTLPLGIRHLFDQLVTTQDRSGLHVLSILLVGVFVLRAGLAFWGQYLLQLTGDKITNDIRVALLRHYQRLPIAYHHRNRIGEFISRLYSDAPEIRNVVTNLTVNGTINLAQLVGASVVMLYMNWRLGLVVLALCPATTVVANLYGPYFRQVSAQIKASLSGAVAYAQETVAGTHVVRIFGADGRDVARFADQMDGHLEMAGKGRRADASYMAIVTLLTVVSTIVLFWYGATEVLASRMTVGSLVAFFLYSQGVNQSITVLAQQYSTINQSLGASARVFELLAEPAETEDPWQGQQFTARRATIEFKDVSFRYHDSVPVLEKVSFRALPGQTVALHGRSGIGKSSLLGLLPRFYAPTSGTICINGIDITQYSLASLRSAISMVSQDVFLFSSSVRENIRYGRPDATDAEVEQAARDANAHDFIRGLKDGYDTAVGERGVQLSGGQRQRIAIARALLRDAPILILDEATSAVDGETDALIHAALERLTANRTTLVVAHRMSTVERADAVVHLEAAAGMQFSREAA
ncbi:ABC transporter ATP-binding protein [Pseudoduganella sp. R-34]|uniref:ABC transporter ATP-binding protein n=1 Tax=Pseudoduganella sp. R-34 TaxID=3404062 RepID=UPI003CF0EE48